MSRLPALRPRFPGRILILPYPGIGDAILHGPALQTLNRAFPGRLLYPENAAFEIFQALGVAELGEVSLVPKRMRRLFDLDRRELRDELLGHRVTVVLNFRRDRVTWGAQYVETARAIAEAGVSISDVCDSVSVEYQSSVHTTRLLGDYLDRMGLDASLPRFGWLSEDTLIPAPDPPCPDGAIGYFLGASQETKRLPINFWHEAIAGVARLLRRPTVVMCGIGGDEVDFGRELSARLTADGVPHRLVSGMSLTALTSLAAHLALVASCDTFMVHLAEAVGTPTIGVYCSTDPRLYGPIGSRRYVDGGFRVHCPLHNRIGNCAGWDLGCSEMPCKRFVRARELVKLIAEEVPEG